MIMWGLIVLSCLLVLLLGTAGVVDLRPHPRGSTGVSGRRTSPDNGR
jgi:hypothetical protein